MRGRDVLMQSLVAHGVDTIFGNPGTTENPLLESLVDTPEITYYMTLHEGVAVCAAGTYARASDKTSVANVHVAPGLGNAIGMMYGVLKARLPVIVTAGQQDTRMRLREPLLQHDLVAMAAPVTKWSVQPGNADEVAEIVRRAVMIANTPPRGPVFIALPNNVMEQETAVTFAPPVARYGTRPANKEAIDLVAGMILTGKRTLVIAGDDAATADTRAALSAFVERVGAAVRLDLIPATLPVPFAHPNYAGRLPVAAAEMNAIFSTFDTVILVGNPTLEEIWYDSVPPIPSTTQVVQIEPEPVLLASIRSVNAGVCGDPAQVLRDLIAAIDHGATEAFDARADDANAMLKRARDETLDNWRERALVRREAAPMSPAQALHALAQATPHRCVVVDESITAATDLELAFVDKDMDYFAGRGGGIGQGLAGAIGAAAAYPRDLTIAVSGDGSAMYSIQALWTAAHHALNILFVVLANAEYRVLKHNLDAHRSRFDAPSDEPYPHMNLTDPALDFVSMAQGMGVPAARAQSPEEIAAAVERLLRDGGPALIELVVTGKDT